LRRAVEELGHPGIFAGVLNVAVEAADYGGVIAAFGELEPEDSPHLVEWRWRGNTVGAAGRIAGGSRAVQSVLGLAYAPKRSAASPKRN
jgi:hypothetical protein